MFHTCHNRGRHRRSHSSSLSFAFLPALETHGLLNSRCGPSPAWGLPPQAVTAKGEPAASKTEVEPALTGQRSRNSAAQAHGAIHLCVQSQQGYGNRIVFSNTSPVSKEKIALHSREDPCLQPQRMRSHLFWTPVRALPSQTPSASPLLSLLSFTFPHTILGAPGNSCTMSRSLPSEKGDDGD